MPFNGRCRPVHDNFTKLRMCQANLGAQQPDGCVVRVLFGQQMRISQSFQRTPLLELKARIFQAKFNRLRLF